MKIKLKEYFGFKKLKGGWKPMLVLAAGVVLTITLTLFIYRNNEKETEYELSSIGQEIALEINARLRTHAVVLRAGIAHFAVSDTVTRENWKEFVEQARLDVYLPGTQGTGYSVVIPPGNLHEHIEMVREEGFPDYRVYPEGERELYTSIIFLEPFEGRNLRAFGYDMYSDPVRRRAMEISRDRDLATLSGKVDLVQETGDDVQSGTLMYVPYYNPEKPVGTIEERREAIKGWVYSPYRMADLMQGILGRWDELHNYRIKLQVYDDSLSVASLLYDSQKNDNIKIQPFKARTLTMPVEFNGKKWVLLFAQSRGVSYFQSNVLIVFFGGIIISILLYLLSLSYFKIKYRSTQIKNQNKELHKLNATKDKFFSIIAHDLKSPFNSIIGFSRILIEQVEKKKYEGVVRYAEIIHQSSNVAMELLMNLMEWSQSQTGRIVFNPEKFELVALMHDVELLFIDVAKHKSIEIRNEVPEKMMVYGDYDMIGTVLRNLISNALKFTHPKGKIIVKAWEVSQGHVISVSDTGVGIPQDKVDKLFRIDESYSTSGTHNEKGTGLGLILCREFVEKHGGKIWVETQFIDSSEKIGGSTFYFTLPSNKKKEKIHSI